ncbi:MAG: 4Fe-4S binding protein [Chitinispirillaceae bacterium]|nr:4Fe-4S binding protein [Chitinispirillaceae bacterium]
MKKIRIFVQVVFFLLFSALFFFAHKLPSALTFDSDFLMKFNPFATLLTFLASHSVQIENVIIGVLVIGLTVVLGRVFCGYFCPLGAMIDFFDRYVFSKMRSRHRRPPQYVQRFKYMFMGALIIFAVFGGIFTLYFDPLSFTTRLFTYIFDPIITVIGTDILRFSGTLMPTAETTLYGFLPKRLPLYYGIAATFVSAFLIFAGGFWDRRFFCQYICPSGAFFGLLSRFTLFKRVVNENKCNSCMRCVKSCPVHAISEKNSKLTNVSECIECGECTDLKESCTSFRFVPKADVLVSGPDLKRRHLVNGALGGLALIPMFRTTGVSKRDETGRMIRPPGAVPESQFLGKCIGCGTCIKACPTNALQPSTFFDGFNRIYTPKVVPRIAGCEEKCTLCGYVCPTGAINKLGIKEKKFVRIGTAIIDRHRCIAWEQNRHCLVCDEVCPYNAIEGREVKTVDGVIRAPVVNEDLCVGCGMCEQHCPVFDTAAIVVYRFGENRRLKGPYMTETEMADIDKLRHKSDSEHFGSSPFIDEDDAVIPVSSDPYGLGQQQQGGGEQKLPDAFLE